MHELITQLEAIGCEITSETYTNIKKELIRFSFTAKGKLFIAEHGQNHFCLETNYNTVIFVEIEQAEFEKIVCNYILSL